MMILNRFGRVVLGVVTGLFWTMPGRAQTVMSTSGTGDVGTTINASGSFTITGGTQQLNTLFHSFEAFSPTTADVLFQLDPSQSSVEYVIGRVTGNSTSQIDGVLKLTGGNSPDLFLLNPAGITFGANASLLLPGSFFTSTAESISFQGNMNFSSASPSAAPLLTVSAPVGLQFGTAANPITLEQSQLEVNPGESLGFLGGDLQLAGSLLRAEGGQLSLGSVAPSSQVGFDSNTFQMDYTNTNNFQDITLTQEAFADVSGDGGGSFQIQGRAVSLLEDSVLEASNYGASDGSIASIRASEKIEVVGTFGYPSSAIYADVYDSGKGNHLRLETEQLLLSQSAFITADTYDLGMGGGITINANEVLISGNPDGDGVPTVLGSGTFGDGQGGNLTITANRFIAEDWLVVGVDTSGFGPDTGTGGNLILTVSELALRNGAQMGTGTFGDGNSGNLMVTATDSVEITGFGAPPSGVFSSGLFSSAERGSTGNAGSVTITTPRLLILNGGKVAVNTVGEGNGGNITIRAEEIEVADPVVDSTRAVSGLVANVVTGASGNGGSLDIETMRLRVYNGGQITASTEGDGNAGIVNIRADEVDVSGTSDDGLFSSSITSGSTTNFDAGSVTLNSDSVTVRDGAILSVSSLGGGNSGNLNISSDRLYLNNGTLQSLVTAGSEGNLNLTAERILLMRQGSQITTSATGSATGGNVSIVAPVIVGIENSDIVANAVFGSGGNIDITTQSLLGLAFRDQLTPESDITASSEFGVNGSVEINNLTVDPGAALIELPEAPVDADDQIATACASSTGSQFVASGRGGLPIDPTRLMASNQPWVDFRALSPFYSSDYSGEGETIETGSVPKNSVVNLDSNLVESAGWSLNDDGQVELLTAETSGIASIHPVNCLTEASAG